MVGAAPAAPPASVEVVAEPSAEVEVADSVSSEEVDSSVEVASSVALVSVPVSVADSLSVSVPVSLSVVWLASEAVSVPVSEAERERELVAEPEGVPVWLAWPLALLPAVEATAAQAALAAAWALVRSSGLVQAASRHGATSPVRRALVSSLHWQAVSSSLQPLWGMAVMRQLTCLLC